jgi:hypothetical protein
MHDQPEPTPEEQELAPERQAEEQAKQYPAHEDPERVRDEPQDETEIHDA